MISIIICSQRSRLDNCLVENIKQTVGVDYEIVHIDNSTSRYSIFAAYNLGIGKARGEFLCLMHEDVTFHTEGWGRVVENYLSEDAVGALGVAGGNVVLSQLDWRFYGFASMYLIQGTSTIDEHPRYYRAFEPEGRQVPLRQVAAIDGVWMCFRKEMFQKIRFDEEHFHDFHLYDTDICMQVNKIGKGVYITTDILLEHRSMGTFTEGYREALKCFAEKWRNDLPMMRGLEVTQQEIDEALTRAYPFFEERLNQDAMTIELRKLFARRREGLPTRKYTVAEMSLMEDSLYRCCRYFVKSKMVSRSEAWMVVRDYCSKPYATRRISVVLKYVWYRYWRKTK